MSLEPGTNLGQYRVVERVGRGGMATVYKAYQPGLDRYVAIKVLPAFYAEEPTYLERFRQEARSVARLRHPNILTVFDFGEQNGITYIVSEFVPGGTLAQKMGGPLPLHQVVSLLRPIASALEYAHSQGIVHRDIKPSNILMAEEGTPIVSDFGVARMVGGVHLTESGAAVGTPEYMAPEQATGVEVGPTSDIYSLGIVLYEMVTGRVPFTAETPMAVVLAHLHDPLSPPSALVPTLPESVEAVILKALAKQPEDRFSTAGDMARALESAVSVLPASTTEAAPPSRGAAGITTPTAATSAPATGMTGAKPATPAAAAPSKSAMSSKGRATSSSKVGRLSPTLLAGVGIGVIVLIALLATAIGGAFRAQPTPSPGVSAAPTQPPAPTQPTVGVQPIALQPGQGEPTVDSTVRVGVYDPRGRPVPDVEVEIRDSRGTGGSKAKQLATTDSGGLVEFRVPSGIYTLRLNSSTVPAGYTTASDQIPIAANAGTVTNSPITLVPAKSEAPVPGPSGTLLGQTGQPATQSPPAQPAPQPAQPQHAGPPPGEARGGDSVLKVKVLDPSGQPVPGLEVGLFTAGSPLGPPDAGGSMTLNDGTAMFRAAAGEYEFDFRPDTFPQTLAIPMRNRVTLTSGETKEVTINLTPRPAGQTGPQTYPYGQPGIQSQPRQPGGSMQPPSGQPGQQPLVLPSEVGQGDATIKVKIRDVAGNPVPGLEVDLWTSNALQGPPNAGIASTNRDGEALFHVGPGSYQVGFNTNGFPPQFAFPARAPAEAKSGITLDVPVRLTLR